MSEVSSRNDIVELTRRNKFPEEEISHSIAVADVAVKICNAMISRGLQVNKDVVEKGALLHDIGYLRLKGELVELPEWKPYGIKFPSDDINHPGLGEIIVKDWGFKEEVADCVLKHNIGGFTLSECKLLKIDPLPTKDCAPHTLEQKVVHFADHLILLKRIKISPFEDSQASGRAVLPWLKYYFAERANVNIAIDSPIVQREVALNRELCKYVNPAWIDM